MQGRWRGGGRGEAHTTSPFLLLSAAAGGADHAVLLALVDAPRLADGALAVAAEVAAAACAPGAVWSPASFPALAGAARRLAPPFAIWAALPDAAAALAAARPPAPPTVLALLDAAAVRLEEVLVWEAGSDIYGNVLAVAASAAGRDIDEAVEALLRNVADRATDRARHAGAALAAAGRPPLPACFADRAACLAYSLAATRLSLFYGQHLSVIVACIVYGLARARNVALKLAAAERAAAGAAPHAAGVLAGRSAAELAPATVDKPAVRGTVREFYNGPFLDAARDLLQAERDAAVEVVASPAPAARAPPPPSSASPAPSPKLARMPLATLTAADVARRAAGGGVNSRRGGVRAAGASPFGSGSRLGLASPR